VALNQAFRFQFGVGVGDSSAVNAQQIGEFTAGGNAIARPQIAGMD